jgi:choloylglycine hydrolase
MKKINSMSDTSRFFLVFPLIVLFMIPALSVFPCSSFLLKNGEQMVFGKNYDWHLEFGYLMINKRGVAKTAMQAGTATDSPATWTSRYGSVTFNQYGREFPMGGMNEAGLAIEIMMLNETEYPIPDSRPVVKNLQWVQYQLDRFSTVKELLAGLSLVRIPPSETYGLHYFACDKTGQCASIEFLNGRTVIHTKETLPVNVLTNSTYQNSLAFYKRAGMNLPTGTGSLDRFARAAGLIQVFNPKKTAPYWIMLL